jgi:hypothetical protein
VFETTVEALRICLIALPLILIADASAFRQTKCAEAGGRSHRNRCQSGQSGRAYAGFSCLYVSGAGRLPRVAVHQFQRRWPVAARLGLIGEVEESMEILDARSPTRPEHPVKCETVRQLIS